MAAAAFAPCVLAVMPVSFAVLAAGAVSFSLVTMFVFAAAAAFFLLAFVTAALCRAGSIMVRHFVFLRRY